MHRGRSEAVLLHCERCCHHAEAVPDGSDTFLYGYLFGHSISAGLMIGIAV